ncbi:MAG: substrate-binding domain-containing protein [Bacteroidales bacterium]|nr:substrate-binding domain-containing protein [Bacteroidales bacterium]
MRRFFAIILFGVLLTSCIQEKKFVVGVSQCSQDLWRDEVNRELELEALMKQDIELRIKSVKDNSALQIKDIKDFIADKVDLLVVSPNEADALSDVISEATAKGIPVVLFDRKTVTDDYAAFIGADNYNLAYTIGGYLAERLKYSGNIVILRGYLGSTADADRYRGFMDAIKEYPDIHILAETDAGFLRDPANRKMTMLIDSLGIDNKINAVFAFNDQMAAGVDDAFIAKNYINRPFIVGIDGLLMPGGGVDFISRGKMDATFVYPTGGAQIIETVSKILHGLPYDRETTLNSSVIDRSNYKTYQLQYAQIAQQQQNLEKLTELLDKALMRFSQQKTVIFVLFGFIGLSILLMFGLWYSNRENKRLNSDLSRQNLEINEKVDILDSQKTKLEKMSKELEVATNAKLIFFTDISHEFKTPLTLILGPIEEILKSSSLSIQDRESLSIVRRNARKLLSLLNQILEFRRYEGGQMVLKCTPGNLDEFIRSLNGYFENMTSQKKIQFSYSVDNANYDINFDKGKIEKIYFNILSNAFKFVPPQGVVNVFLSMIDTEEGKSFTISVFNSGSFIPEEYRKNIFRRFYHLGDSSVNSGIGLALSKALAKSHKGNITVQSEKMVGTTFTVTIPADLSSVENYTEADLVSNFSFTKSELSLVQPEVISRFNDNFLDAVESDKLSVLVVEDNIDVQLYLYNILSPEYNVLLASDGEDGIDKAIKSLPALVVTDAKMPKLDGYQVTSKLKNNMLTRDIPVIMLTAYDTDEQRAMGYESGADAYISKPFSADVLKIRIRKLIESRHKAYEGQTNPLFDSSKTYNDTQVEFMNTITQYITDNIQEAITVEDICEHVGISKPKLYRQLKEITDYSPIDLVNIVKLRKSINLMLNERKNISETAYSVGFNSPSYFTRQFIKYYGVKPSEYIKNNIN